MSAIDEVYVNSNYPSVTAEQVNQYFFDSNKPDFNFKTTFYCCENCSAEISCANYTVDFSNQYNRLNKISPYFADRLKMKHDPSCTRWKKLSKKRDGRHDQTKYYIQNGNDFVIDFIPNVGLIPLTNVPQTTTSARPTGGTNTTKTSSSSSLNKQANKHHYSSLGKIIELFEEYLSGNTYITFHDRSGNSINLNDIFEEIPRLSGSHTQISNSPKIYFGQAKAEYFSKNNVVDENRIKITYTGKASFGCASPTNISFLIFRDSCKKSRKTGLFNQLERLAKAREKDYSDPSAYFTFYYEGTFADSYSYEKNGKIITNNFVNSLYKSDKLLPHIDITPN